MGNLCCGLGFTEEAKEDGPGQPRAPPPRRPSSSAAAAAAAAAAAEQAATAAAPPAAGQGAGGAWAGAGAGAGAGAAAADADADELRALAAAPALDEERLQELVGVVDLRETLHGFIKHGRQLLDGLAAGIESRDTGTAKAAHALKGAAKTVGAARLAACAQAIEEAAKREGADVGECARYVPSLRAALDDLAGEICRRQWD